MIRWASVLNLNICIKASGIDRVDATRYRRPRRVPPSKQGLHRFPLMLDQLAKLVRPSCLRRLSLLAAFVIFVISLAAVKQQSATMARNRFAEVAQAPLHTPTSPVAAVQVSVEADLFEQQVRPILQAHCFRCHGSDKQRGGLRVDSMSGLLKGGHSGPALVPHEPGQSLLIAAIMHQDDLKMPPAEKLNGEQIRTLTDWVSAGARWPSSEMAASVSVPLNGTSLWSLQPVTKHDPPPPAISPVPPSPAPPTPSMPRRGR